MSDMTFKKYFFALYDKKLLDGSLTFADLGITKEQFVELCVDEDFLPEEDMLIELSNRMKLTEEEDIKLFELAEEERKKRRETVTDADGHSYKVVSVSGKF